MANGAIVVDVVIAEADDVVPPNDPADHGKVLARNSTTHKYEHVAIGGGGGGTSDHAALTHLDYASAGHTGFAGTDVANVFSRKQTLEPSADDLTLGDELLTDVAFPDLTNWNDDASGWNVVSGGITHTPGPSGTLSQVVTLSHNNVYRIEIGVSGMTAGTVDFYDGNSLSIEVTTNGVYRAMDYTPSGDDIFSIYASEEFDGKIEYVSLKESLDGSTPIGFPAHIALTAEGYPVCLIRSTDSGGFLAGYAAGRFATNSIVAIGDFALSSITDETDLIAIGPSAGIYAVGLSNSVLIGPSAGDSAAGNGNIWIGPSAGAAANSYNVIAIGYGAGGSVTANQGIYIGAYSGGGETVDSRLHIGNGGDLISGTMNGGDIASQVLQLHAATIALGDNHLRIGDEGGDPTFGIFGATPVLKPTVTGDKAGNEALTALIALLVSLGFVVDATT